MNAAEYNQRLVAQVRRIREAEQNYGAAIDEWATAERLYKLGESIAYAHVSEFKNADDRRAKVEVEPITLPEIDLPTTVNTLRYVAHLAESKMNACKLAVQNRASELSALQSGASLSKAEAEFTKWAPEEVVGT